MSPTELVYREPAVATIDEAIERLDAIGAYADQHEALRDKDGVGRFNDLYAIITRRVREGVNSGFFQDGEFLTVLDVAFANRYLDALRAYIDEPKETPRVWKVLIERRHDERIEAMQFAVAGVNAHINYDLSAAMLETCIKLDREPNWGSQHKDYLRVNEIFAEEMRTLRQSYESNQVREVDSRAARVLDVVGNFTVEKARDVAWEVSEQLWTLRSFGMGTGIYLKQLDRVAALAGNLLLTPII